MTTVSRVERITGFKVFASTSSSKFRLEYEGSPVRETLEELVEANFRYQARKVFEAQGYRCAMCGRVRPLQAHHRKYRSRGRDDRRGNLVGLCAEDHRKDHG